MFVRSLVRVTVDLQTYPNPGWDYMHIHIHSVANPPSGMYWKVGRNQRTERKPM